jgi:DNA-binding PucR family transcriptional regulator
MSKTRPELALERLLLALEGELIDATDDEVLAAAKELGMDPTMKGSSALFGVTILVRWPAVRRDVELPEGPTHTARPPYRKL